MLGEQAYASLADIPFQVDLVDVFRAAEHVPAIVEQCLALHLPAIWIQEGIIAEAAAHQAQDGGMTVVMDRCILKEYVRLMTNESQQGTKLRFTKMHGAGQRLRRARRRAPGRSR